MIAAPAGMLRVLIASTHHYPASVGGAGGCRVLDCLAKGLGELGHHVFYWLEKGSSLPPPPGVTFVSAPVAEFDIAHVYSHALLDTLGLRGKPWVRTRHVDSMLWSLQRTPEPNTIYVSRTLAQCYGSEEYVWNGIDPDEYLYSERKSNYVFFLCGLERAEGKGIDIAIAAAKRARVPLVAAGSSADAAVVERFRRKYAEEGAQFVGEVWGTLKARLLAEARALLFPTQWNESFGLVMAEALMSGTPVICSDRGACRELITPDAGFVCRSEDDYVAAIERAGEIAPAECRARAMRHFHYRRMAAGYVEQYRRILSLHEVVDHG